MKLLVASSNRKKLEELTRLVQGLPVEILSPRDFEIPLPDVVEDGDTFAANARKKALAFAAAYGVPAIADDSGICVDALGGAPGIYSARYSGEEPVADRDRLNNEKLLGELAQVQSVRRTAAFHCALCLAFPDGRVLEVERRWPGQVAYTPRGQNGFGYDPLFLLPSLGRTAAELDPAEKAVLSHRGQAMRALRPLIEGLVAETPAGA